MLLTCTASALAQTRPYIGYTFPAGGQQGTKFQIKLGGQGLDDVSGVQVTGSGVTAKVVECYRRINPQEMQLLNEQLKELKRATSGVAYSSLMAKANEKLIARIEKLDQPKTRSAGVNPDSPQSTSISGAPSPPPGSQSLSASRTDTGISVGRHSGTRIAPRRSVMVAIACARMMPGSAISPPQLPE